MVLHISLKHQGDVLCLLLILPQHISRALKWDLLRTQDG